MKIDQWVPAAHRLDAVGDSARRMRSVFRALGHESDLYALTIDDDLRGDVLPWSEAATRNADVTIYHYALPSPLSAPFARLDSARVLLYHNVTPAHFFAPFDAGVFKLARAGREELATLVGVPDLALGVSEFNRAELESMGFERTGVLPLAIDLERLTRAPDRPAIRKMLTDDWANILFVGRIVPNKKIEDHIFLAEHYKRYVDARYRFIFVGRQDAMPAYYAMIRGLIDRFQMRPERFVFTGPLHDEELAAVYRSSHAYVSLSEHEGFCAPLVEAMAMDVPILAYAAGAVPETLGGAGLMFSPKDYEPAAELLGQVIYDESLRSRVLEGQRARVAHFAPDRVDRDLRALVSRFS
jgi:glycosyltransferase involved in cell wall biosynthesis